VQVGVGDPHADEAAAGGGEDTAANDCRAAGKS
jgi:hypothetical protein